MVGSTSAQKSSKKKTPAKAIPVKPLGLPEGYQELFANAQQLLLVTTPNWNSVDGTLRRFEKQDGKWQSVGEATRIVVGKNGLAWDGVADLPFKTADPVKKEGDGRSPAGVFRVTELFGFDTNPSNSKMSYRQLTASVECVDDASSMSYNEIVDHSQIPNADWNSSEKMRTIDVYEHGAVIGYNTDRIPGAGSCIFLHIWKGSGHGTAGCTALDQASLQEILDWLDSGKNSIVVQLPATIYARVKARWGLP
jgi:D-alanyl-D-alanine dipeptidase